MRDTHSPTPNMHLLQHQRGQIRSPPPKKKKNEYGRAKKKIVGFSTKRLKNPLSERKIKKTKNDLLAIKKILHDMGPLTLVRWPL